MDYRLSRSDIHARCPIVYVLSQIPKLEEYLNVYRLPMIAIQSVELPANFDHQLTEGQLQDIEDAEIIVCDKFILINNYMKLGKLKWAHCTSSGIEELFEAIPEKPNFVVTKHAGAAFGQVMAEYIICQILTHERRNKTHWRNQQAKQWQQMDRFKTYRLLNELTVGILGCGTMGHGIAKLLHSCGVTVFGFDRIPRSIFHKHDWFVSICIYLEDILPQCDYIINTLPSTPDTKGLLNDSELEMCMKKPVFINVGRGDVISEDELLLALRSEWISGAVLDVFEQEPLPESSELWKMPQVTITPHVAAVSKPDHIAEEFSELLESVFYGYGLEKCVNWDRRY